MAQYLANTGLQCSGYIDRFTDLKEKFQKAYEDMNIQAADVGTEIETIVQEMQSEIDSLNSKIQSCWSKMEY